MTRPIAVLLLTAVALPAAAATFCATDSASLQNALTTAAGNGEDDIIHVAAGTFVPPTIQGFSYAGTDPHALTVDGGYITFLGNPCGLHFESANASVIDANTNSRLFDFSPYAGSGDLHLARLTFRNGVSLVNNSPVGIGIGGYTGAVTLDRVVVRDNVTAVPAIFVGTAGPVTVRNSVFVDNEITPGYDNPPAIQFESYNPNGSSGGLVFNGNTVAGNISLIAGGNARAVLAVMDGPLNLANNIFWGNTNVDLVVDAEGVVTAGISYNDIGVAQYYGLSDSGGNYHNIDPLFVGGGDYRLTPASPLQNGGGNLVIGGVGSYDAAGGTRIVGQIDVGAYEVQDRIFKNGFE
jgi:hypothetical protein